LCIPDELGFSLSERCCIIDYVLFYSEKYRDYCFSSRLQILCISLTPCLLCHGNVLIEQNPALSFVPPASALSLSMATVSPLPMSFMKSRYLCIRVYNVKHKMRKPMKVKKNCCVYKKKSKTMPMPPLTGYTVPQMKVDNLDTI